MSSQYDPKPIALWGFGRYGRRLLDAIVRHWSARYRVAAVFDASINETGAQVIEGDIPLLPVARIAEEYRNGSFDAVVISVSQEPAWLEISARAKDLGIPVITLVSLSDLQPFDAFDGASKSPLDHGFSVHEYQSLYGTCSALYPWQKSLFLFDAQGRVLADNWFMEYIPYEYCVLNSALPPDKGCAPMEVLNGEYCAVARMWSSNYGHFSYQGLDQIMLMEKAGYAGRYIVKYASSVKQLLDLFGIDASRILWLDDLDPETVYRFEKMLIVDHPSYSFRRSAPALVEASEVIGKNALAQEASKTDYPSHLFVKRIGTRRLEGVDGLLEAYGFQTIVPEEHTVAEQIRYFQHADVVLSPHGANSANSMYMRPGAVLIETFGKGWVNPWAPEVLRLKGVHYLPVSQTPDLGDARKALVNDYTVDNTILEMVIRAAIKLTGGDRSR